MAKITEDMLKELGEEGNVDPMKFIEDYFEDESVAFELLSRITLLSFLLPAAPESTFFTGLSIGIQLGKRLAEIDLLNDRLE